MAFHYVYLTIYQNISQDIGFEFMGLLSGTDKEGIWCYFKAKFRQFSINTYVLGTH